MKSIRYLNLIVIFMFPIFLFSVDIKKLSAQKKQEQKITIDFEKEIVFGQSGSFSGAFKLYGEMIRNAILACFKDVNENGGVHGKQLRLISLDDNGRAYLFEENIRKMLNNHKIDMFLGCMGTRGVLKSLPLIKDGKISMFFPWGGDKKLQDPNLKYIVNGLGLIAPQTDALIKHIVKDLRLSKISIFHSDGTFSKQNTSKAIEQLRSYKIEPEAAASYNKYTLDIKTAANKLLKSDPKAVLCICPSHPSVKLINYFFRNGNFGTQFFGIDSTLFVSDILRTKGVRFSYASSVPDSKDKNIPIVKKYQEALKKFYPKEPFNILSLAYFIQASIVVEAIKKIEGRITKQAILQNIENMKNFDLNGFAINFDPSNRYAFGKNISIIKG